jgi:hypothetical protein
MIAPSTLKLYINRIKKEKESQKGQQRKPKANKKQQSEVTEQVTQQISSPALKPEVPKIQNTPSSRFVEMPDVL